MTDREMIDAQWQEIAGLRNRILEHEQERDTWAAAGKRMRAEADAQIEQYRRDFEAMSARAQELAKESTSMEFERDTYRSMLCDLLSAATQRRLGSLMSGHWDRVRDLLKNGPKP